METEEKKVLYEYESAAAVATVWGVITLLAFGSWIASTFMVGLDNHSLHWSIPVIFFLAFIGCVAARPGAAARRAARLQSTPLARRR